MILKDIFIEFGDKNISNQDFESFLSKQDISLKSEKSGVFSRKVCSENYNVTDISKKIIKDNSLSNRIKNQDLIIVVSEFVEKIIPPPSSFILSEVKDVDCQIIDLNRGCSGFVEALIIANSFFGSNLAKKILVICADNYSKYFDIQDTSVSAIFGDSGSFIFIEKSTKNILFSKTLSSFEGKKHISIIDNKLHMNGPAVLGFVRSSVLPQIKSCVKFADENNIPIENVFVHQGSKLVVNEFNNAFSWSKDFCPFFIKETGNINSSTIPFGLSIKMKKEGSLKGNFIFSGFGVGLSSSTIIIPFE